MQVVYIKQLQLKPKIIMPNSQPLCASMAGKLILTAFLVLSMAPSDSLSQMPTGKKWMVLLASAKGWVNYGMEADVFHAYQIAKEGGIPEEQIIVMAYDEIAQSHLNPFKGKVVHSYDLKDVYKGVKVDYSGDEISKNTFLAVLTGDKKAIKTITGRDGKVVESGGDDTVFVYVSDHGGPGVIGFFDFNYLTAKELNDAITSMHVKNRYKYMIFYVDTCNSGSMFEDILPSDIGVYAVSASGKTESAYSVDCRSDYFQNKSETCLGGLFSINWIYEAQSDDRKLTTIGQQFDGTKAACEGSSTPKQYGDLLIANMPQFWFLGDSAHKSPDNYRRSRRFVEKPHGVPKNMMQYYLLGERLAKLPKNSLEAQETATELLRITDLMNQADEFMKTIATAIDDRYQSESKLTMAKKNFGIINWNCYEPVLKAVSKQCPGIFRREEVRYYAMSQFGLLINLCNERSSDKLLIEVTNVAKSSPVCQL